MFRTVSNRRGFAATILALSLVTTFSLVGCGTDATTAPDIRGGRINVIEDPITEEPGPPERNNENRMEDGR